MPMDREKIVSVGSRFSGQALVDQADVSLAVAAADMPELKKYGWSEARTKNVEGLRVTLKASIARYGGAREAIPKATAGQAEAVAAAKLWLRRVNPLAKNALESAQKVLAITEERLTKTEVRAPFDCTVLTRPVSMGQAVSGSGTKTQ